MKPRTSIPLGDLWRVLRPAGGGIHTVSTGRSEQEALQRTLYGARDAAEVDVRWREALTDVAGARVAILGIPSDTGAGLVRGAAFGPRGVREAVLRARPDFRELAARAGVVDVGDVFVVPQLLTDEMLSDQQRRATQVALYGVNADADLPVAPLSIAERVCDALLTLKPALRLFVLGGDHSVAWPVVAALAAHAKEPWAIVHLDAHTDLLPERLGVRICFATWAYHANERVGRGGRLVQVGVRASGKPKAHWESTLGVKQVWADEVRARGEGVIDEVIAHLRTLGVRRVYLSNDIDATDAADAPATGAPETAGLSPAFVRALIRRVGEAFPLLGADVVEVAPPLGAPEDARRTTDVAAWYMLDALAALTGDATFRGEPNE
ncbi:MAG TPA: arginase family protein [Polyangia bacterium]|nr:arginase family protein [Polyangia bacterium]